MNLAKSKSRSWWVALCLATALPLPVWGEAPPPEPPAPPASGPSGPPPACKERPKLCAALHAANKALIAAARANKSGSNYVCTSFDNTPGCGTTSPRAYLTPDGNGPYGNPSEVDHGRRLLDWYLKNLNCQALCQTKKDPKACEQSCDEGKDPKDFPDAEGSADARARSGLKR